jgi:alpha,alpha-trehalase
LLRLRSIFAWCALVATIHGCAPARTPANQSVPFPGYRDPPRIEPDRTKVAISREATTSALCGIFLELDADCDRRITVDDVRSKACASSGAKLLAGRWPNVARVGDRLITLRSPHQAAQLVQELVLALRVSGAPHVHVNLARAELDPASYLIERIERHFWDALTRRIDADPVALARAASDEKLGAERARQYEFCPEHDTRCAACAPPQSPQTESAVAKEAYVYFPPTDPQALEIFQTAGVPGRLVVGAVPEMPTARWVSELTRTGRHGLLTLALDAEGVGRPFVVPGGRFNEMYGWDSFFIARGLLQDPARVELARSIADNHGYQIAHYGRILNANRTYYLTRSQPPFFTSLISHVWQSLPDTPERRTWLERSLRVAIREYRTVWNSKPRRLGLCDGDVCLARYFGEGRGEPPEVEPGHFDWFYQAHAMSHGHCRRPGVDDESRARFLECTARLADGYRNGRVKDREIDDFFMNDRCVRESGHDTTFRWFQQGREQCAAFATVDLNSLLFKYEVDIATLLTGAFGGALGDESAAAFCSRALARSRLITKYLWDAEAGLFYDYDTARRRRSRYLAATTLYPLWASQRNVCEATLVTPAMAKPLVENALKALEAPGGLLAASPASAATVRHPTLIRPAKPSGFEISVPGRQWEAPNGWAPHQLLAWEALAHAGFENDAARLRYKWLYTIVKNAASYHGTVPEKFDVVLRSHAVFQEYGNVNTDFSYISDEGFGWMNASFVVGFRALDAELRESLQKVVPPERVFDGG